MTSVDPDGYVVTAHGITRSFDARPVLRGVDLAVRQGEFVCVVGRSGVGKTTLLRVLAGLDRDFAGTVAIDRRRGLMFQDPSLLPWQRVLTNVTLGLPKREARDAGLRALAEVGLEDRPDAWPLDLSGGERQRVALARALVRRPRLLLLDEPFGALDAFTRTQMQQLLNRVVQAHAAAGILVTHDLDEAILLANRVIVLANGRITLEVPVNLPGPRDPSDQQFQQLRLALLDALTGATQAERTPPARQQLNAHAGDESPEPFP